MIPSSCCRRCRRRDVTGRLDRGTRHHRRPYAAPWDTIVERADCRTVTCATVGDIEPRCLVLPPAKRARLTPSILEPRWSSRAHRLDNKESQEGPTVAESRTLSIEPASAIMRRSALPLAPAAERDTTVALA